MGDRTHTAGWGHHVAALAETQHGVVGRWQLREVGLTDREIVGRIESGELHPVFRGAFAVGHRAIGGRGRLMAATLACGPGAAISHRSAAWLHGLWKRLPPALDVVGPRQGGRGIDGIRWHRARELPADHLTVIEGVPCTAVSRTVVDMAGVVGPEALRGLVEDAAVARVLDLAAIDQVLSRGRRRGSPALRVVLEPWREYRVTPRLRSRLEARFVTALHGVGLPAPWFNAKLSLAGRGVEADMLWTERRLIVEGDGEETHGTRLAFERDRRRDQELHAAGYTVLRVTWRQIEEEPEGVAVRIRRAYASAA